jgi:hypothetical protein
LKAKSNVATLANILLGPNNKFIHVSLSRQRENIMDLFAEKIHDFLISSVQFVEKLKEKK